MEDTQTVVAARSTEIVRVVEQSGLDASTGSALVKAYTPFWMDAQSVVQQSAGIVVTDPTQVTEIKESRALRLKLRAIRTDAEKVRKTMKEDSFKRGKAIDNVNNALLLLIEPEEKRLEEQEKIAERIEAERKAANKAMRDAEIRKLGGDPQFYQLGDMSEVGWKQLIEALSAQKEARELAEKKLAEERAEAQAAHIAEQQRIREENARLKAEADEREKAVRIECEKAETALRAAQEKARIEREAIEARARKERVEADAIAAKERAEQQAKADADRRAADEPLRKERAAREAIEAKERARKIEAENIAAAEAKAKRKAEAAPDREKLVALAEEIGNVEMPALVSQEANRGLLVTRGMIDATIAFIHDLAEKL